MTVLINQFTHASMPEGIPLATVDRKTGDLTLWPAGIGQGTAIMMSQAEWRRLRASANGAIEMSLPDGAR